MKITVKEDELQVDVVRPTSKKNKFDELHLHGDTDSSESIILEKVHLSFFFQSG